MLALPSPVRAAGVTPPSFPNSVATPPVSAPSPGGDPGHVQEFFFFLFCPVMFSYVCVSDKACGMKTAVPGQTERSPDVT